MKRICLVSYLFAPVLSAESMALLKKVRVLAEHFEMTVVAAKNDSGVYPNDSLLEKYVPSNVEVLRVPVVLRPNPLHKAVHTAGRILFRGSWTAQYYDLLWAKNTAAVIRRQIASGRKFDALMTNAQHMSSHVAGHWLRPTLNVPWIQHYSDPIQYAATRKAYLPAQKVDDWFLRKVMPKASLVTVPSPEMKACLYDAFDPELRRTLTSKTVVVPHTYDQEFMADSLKLFPNSGRYFNDPDTLHICYTGNLYNIRGAELVANMARRLSGAATRKKILIHVFGSVRGKDRRQLDKMGDQVRFHGNVSYFESLAVMQKAGMLLLLDVPVPGSPFFPSKLAEYLGTQRPIIVVATPDSAAARIAREMGLALCPHTEQPVQVEEDTHGNMGRRIAYSNRTENYRELIDRIDNLTS